MSTARFVSIFVNNFAFRFSFVPLFVASRSHRSSPRRQQQQQQQGRTFPIARRIKCKLRTTSSWLDPVGCGYRSRRWVCSTPLRIARDRTGRRWNVRRENSRANLNKINYENKNANNGTGLGATPSALAGTRNGGAGVPCTAGGNMVKTLRTTDGSGRTYLGISRFRV